MTQKNKNGSTKQKPEHTLSCGEVTARIYLRQSNCGYPYYDFSLGRTWKSVATGKECHGATFFDKNEEDLVQAVRGACVWIRERLTSDRSGPSIPRQEDPAGES